MMKNKKGFTLVEFIIITALIGVMVIIAIMVIGNMKKQKARKIERDFTAALEKAALSYGVGEEILHLSECYLEDVYQCMNHIITVKELKDLGYFEDNMTYCKEEVQIVLYKKYSNHAVFIPKNTCLKVEE